VLVKPYQNGNLELVASIKKFFSIENFLMRAPHDVETFDFTAMLQQFVSAVRL